MSYKTCAACGGDGDAKAGPAEGTLCVVCRGRGKILEIVRQESALPAAPELNARYAPGWYYCWLIEKRGLPQPLWLAADGEWTLDANAALWFSRQSDAERCRVTSGNDFVRIVVCEHGFMIDEAFDRVYRNKLATLCEAVMVRVQELEGESASVERFTRAEIAKKLRAAVIYATG